MIIPALSKLARHAVERVATSDRLISLTTSCIVPGRFTGPNSIPAINSTPHLLHPPLPIRLSKFPSLRIIVMSQSQCCPPPVMMCCPPAALRSTLVYKGPSPACPKKKGAAAGAGASSIAGIAAACSSTKPKKKRRIVSCVPGMRRLDKRVYRNGQFMCTSYAGHIPGEMYIYGRNLPTATTYAKKRLCQYTPYEFVGVDGCCSFCTYP